MAFHSRSAALNRAGDRHILEDASLAFDPQGDNFLPHPLAIGPGELDQFIKPAGGLEEGVGQVKREGGAVAIAAGFEVVEEPTDVGEEEVADLGFLVERGSILANGFFRSQCL